MPMHVVIPDRDPLMTLLERRAERRGLASGKDKRKLRKRLPKLVRSLVSERLSQLEEHGDPLELNAQANSTS